MVPAPRLAFLAGLLLLSHHLAVVDSSAIDGGGDRGLGRLLPFGSLSGGDWGTQKTVEGQDLLAAAEAELLTAAADDDSVKGEGRMLPSAYLHTARGTRWTKKKTANGDVGGPGRLLPAAFSNSHTRATSWSKKKKQGRGLLGRGLLAAADAGLTEADDGAGLGRRLPGSYLKTVRGRRWSKKQAVSGRGLLTGSATGVEDIGGPGRVLPAAFSNSHTRATNGSKKKKGRGLLAAVTGDDASGVRAPGRLLPSGSLRATNWSKKRKGRGLRAAA